MGSRGENAFAHWLFTYPTAEISKTIGSTRAAEDLYYTRTAVDRSSGARTGPSLSNWLRIDNVREVTINRTTTEIDVQVWHSQDIRPRAALHENANGDRTGARA